MGAVAAGIAILAPIAAGFLQKDAINEQADADASAAEYNADLDILTGHREASRRRLIARREKSSQRVAFAKAGVTMEGTPLEVLAQFAADAERDAAGVEFDAILSARLEKSKASNIRSTAKTRGRAALASGFATGAGRALSLVG